MPSSHHKNRRSLLWGKSSSPPLSKPQDNGGQFCHAPHYRTDPPCCSCISLIASAATMRSDSASLTPTILGPMGKASHDHWDFTLLEQSRLRPVVLMLFTNCLLPCHPVTPTIHNLVCRACRIATIIHLLVEPLCHLIFHSMDRQAEMKDFGAELA